MSVSGPVRIMVVEDCTSDVMLLGEALSEHAVSYEFTHYCDGAEAVANLKNPAVLRLLPDLIVLDLNMPKMGGLEVLERIRKTNAFGQVPVAILTSSLQPEEQAIAHRLGADRFIQKPVDLYSYLDEVGKELCELLALGRQASAA